MKLEDLPKKNIYQVPEGYFEKLPGVLMNQVTQDAPAKSFVFTFWQMPYLRPALAGVALLLAFALLFIFRANPAPEENILLASITEKEALEYLLQSENIDSHDLAELSQSKNDLLHEFIEATPEQIEHVVELEDVEDYYTN